MALTDLGLEPDEELLATLHVSFARRRTVDPGSFGPNPAAAHGANPAMALRLRRRPTMSGIGAYRRWSADAQSAGFPVGGMTMVLGLTHRRLVVYAPTFVRGRPKRCAGAVALSEIAQISSLRSVLTARVIVLLADGSIVELETNRLSRARRFVGALVDQQR